MPTLFKLHKLNEFKDDFIEVSNLEEIWTISNLHKESTENDLIVEKCNDAYIPGWDAYIVYSKVFGIVGFINGPLESKI